MPNFASSGCINFVKNSDSMKKYHVVSNMYDESIETETMTRVAISQMFHPGMVVRIGTDDDDDDEIEM